MLVLLYFSDNVYPTKGKKIPTLHRLPLRHMRQLLTKQCFLLPSSALLLPSSFLLIKARMRKIKL